MDGSTALAGDARTLEELEAEITELAGHLNAAHYRWLCLIAEFDRRRGWVDGALASCAHWLNFKCGLDLGAAREKVRVAHALVSLPQIATAMGRGQLSYSKVRALTRVAKPATEEYFLSIALHGTASHVEKLVRLYRRADEAEALSREARQQAHRRLHYWFDDDGSLVIKGRLPATAGALLIQALEAANEAASEAAEGEAVLPEASHAARRADALGLIAESFLQRGAPALRTADRFQVVVHVDAETLRHGGPGRCEVEGATALPVETVRRLACDASVVTVLEDEAGEPVAIGRKTRTIAPALRRALQARDRGCRFPGCTHRRYVDAHHIHHWAHGGETSLGNLVMLCRRHHRSLHEGGMLVERAPDGELQFRRPDGRPFDPLPAGRDVDFHGTELAQRHACNGPPIDGATAVTRWRGERMDYDLAVDVLLQQAERRV